MATKADKELNARHESLFIDEGDTPLESSRRRLLIEGGGSASEREKLRLEFDAFRSAQPGGEGEQGITIPDTDEKLRNLEMSFRNLSKDFLRLEAEVKGDTEDEKDDEVFENLDTKEYQPILVFHSNVYGETYAIPDQVEFRGDLIYQRDEIFAHDQSTNPHRITISGDGFYWILLVMNLIIQDTSAPVIGSIVNVELQTNFSGPIQVNGIAQEITLQIPKIVDKESLETKLSTVGDHGEHKHDVEDHRHGFEHFGKSNFHHLDERLVISTLINARDHLTDGQLLFQIELSGTTSHPVSVEASGSSLNIMCLDLHK